MSKRQIWDGEDGRDRAWIELDTDALARNVRWLQSLLPDGCRLMPAVKANAYGHGAAPVAHALQALGVDAFCVACVQEGVELRENGIHGDILILGYTHPSQFPLLARFRLTQTAVDYGYAKLLSEYGAPLHVHIGVDTGMHRLGERSENIAQLSEIFRMKNLCIDGIFSHLAASDRPDVPEDRALSQAQIAAFRETLAALEKRGVRVPKKHLLSSYGLLHYPEAAYDWVRVGIALYGILSSEEDTKALGGALAPVLSFKARVASVRVLHAGETAGYARGFTAASERTIAAVAVGYADGLPRSVSPPASPRMHTAYDNEPFAYLDAPIALSASCNASAVSSAPACVLLHGKRAPIIGRICMDQTLIDVTEIPETRAGDIVTLIGSDGKEAIGAGELAAHANTITNELLSRLGARLPRLLTRSPA